MSLIVVSDASPMRALHHLGLLPVCRDLYGKVIVPAEVAAELRRATSTCPGLDIATYPWFEVRAASIRTANISTDLDPGEHEAIELAIELKADLLLIDERKGDAVAKRLGLTTIGVLGLRLEAKRRKLIPLVTPCVDRLVRDLRFFVSQSLRRSIADLAGEPLP